MMMNTIDIDAGLQLESFEVSLHRISVICNPKYVQKRFFLNLKKIFDSKKNFKFFKNWF